MNLKQIEKLKKKELSQRVDDAFQKAEEKGPGYWAEAEFYMRELEHRRDSRVSLRDLLLEIAVIGLIGWEILMGYRAEDLQKQNFKDEKAVIGIADNQRGGVTAAFRSFVMSRRAA